MPTPQSQQTKNPSGGIFQYLLQINGSDAEVRKAQAQLAQLTPETAAIYQTLNVLPEGELKSWLMANPVQFWKKIAELIFGRKYTRGDYTLAERMNDQIYCNPDIGQGQASNEMVDAAHTIFNQLFGVRIATAEDLDALDLGWNIYKTRPASQGISDEAIDRAVWLKTNFYPISTYNVQCWDLSHFEQNPLVDRIPDYELGKWYTGPLIGGAYAVDGVIPVNANAILTQDIGAEFVPVTTTTTTAAAQQSFLDKIISYAKANPALSAVAAAVLGYVIYEVVEEED